MKLNAWITFAGLALIAVIAGCGNNNTAATNGSCAAGQVPTQYGCLAQGSCPAGQAWYNNACIAATNYQQTGLNQCQAGQVSTQYGCQAQAYNCGQAPAGQGFAFVNNQCVLGTLSTGYTNGYSNCQAGQVSTTQYGCQAQAYNCGQAPAGQGFAFVNNACVLGTLSTGYNNGYPQQPGYGYPQQGYGQQCGYGAVYTQVGCLPTAGCPANYGFMNNLCYQAIQSGYTNGGSWSWGYGWRW